MNNFAGELAEFTLDFYERYPFLVQTNINYTSIPVNNTLIEYHSEVWQTIQSYKPRNVVDIGSGAGFIKITAPSDVDLCLTDVVETDEIDYFTEVRNHFQINLSYYNKRFLIQRNTNWLQLDKKFDIVTAIRFLPWNDQRVTFTSRGFKLLLQEVDNNLTEQGVFMYNPVNVEQVKLILDNFNLHVQQKSHLFIFNKQDIDNIMKVLNVYA